MSSILKKETADRMAFLHKPKSFQIEVSDVAKNFVITQGQVQEGSGFKVAEVVAQLSGIETIRRENIEKQVETTVLERLKEVQEQAYKQAYSLGLTEGTADAFEEKKAEFSAKLTSLDQALVSIEHMKENMFKQAETALVKVAYMVASRIALREISSGQEFLPQILSELVMELQTSDSITIKLNPIDFQFIEDLRKKNVKEVERLERVKLLPQDEIKVGGCFIETNYGEIDASVEQRVEKAWAIFEQKLPRLQKDKIV